jgi:hypothetical protein
MFDDIVEGVAAPDLVRTTDLLIKTNDDYAGGLAQPERNTNQKTAKIGLRWYGESRAMIGIVWQEFIMEPK